MSARVSWTPHAYQARAVDWLLERPATGLWAQMGLGKTVVTATAVRRLLDQCMVERVLVVAPKRVAAHAWPGELAKWTHLEGLTWTLIEGDARERARRMLEPTDVHLIGRELLPWLVETSAGKGPGGRDGASASAGVGAGEATGAWPYDMVVVDEASGFKDPDARRFKALKRIRPQLERIVELTGTPAPNSLLELWPQVYLLDRGARLGRAFSAFREAWFESDYMGWRWTPRPGAEAEIQRRVEDLALTLKAEDWLALPERVDRVLPVPLPAEARARYRRLERELVLELGEAQISAVNAGVLAGKLLQAANGALYAEDGEWHRLHDAKLDALEDLLEAAEGEPVLVAYAYRSDRERLLARFPQAVELRAPGAIDAWNRGEVPMLLAHPASGGHGLNLQAGGRHVVWWGLTWSLELYQQLTARLHRQGQTRPVLVHHLVAEGTLDETVMAALAGKAATQDALLEAVKRRWAAVMREGA